MGQDGQQVRRQYQCRCCGEYGHNRRSCPVRLQAHEAVRAEFEAKAQEREQEIESLRSQLNGRGDLFEREKLKWEIRRLRAEARAARKVLANMTASDHPFASKHFPAVMGLSTGTITLLGTHFEQIPHSEILGSAMVICASGVVAFWLAGWGVRCWLMRRLW